MKVVIIDSLAESSRVIPADPNLPLFESIKREDMAAFENSCDDTTGRWLE
jgi:hypothetical protein